MMMSQTKLTAGQTYRRLFGYLKPYWHIFALGIVANATYGYVDTEFVKAFEPLIDDAIYGDNKELLAFAPIFIVLIIFARGIASFIATYAMSYVGTCLVRDLRGQLFDKYMDLPARFFDKHPSSELISKLTYNSEQLKQSTTEAVTTIVRSIAVIGFALVGMFSNSWQLSAIFLVTAPVIALLVHFISRRFRAISHRIQGAMSDITQVTQEGVDGYETIRVYGGENQERNRFYNVNNNNRQQSMKLESTRAASVSVIQVIAGVGIAVVFYFGVQMINDGALTGGSFIATLMLMALILKPLKDLTSVNAMMQRGIAAADSLFEVIDLDKEFNPGNLPLTELHKGIHITIENFTYPDASQPAVNQFQCSFNKGETTAIVGQSGSGKSTLIAILLRFYPVDKGTIRWDDIDTDQIELASYRQAFAYVSQHVILFNATIAENIAYGALADTPREAIIDACEQANAMEFIQQLPDGLDTKIGERGMLLSGGQRQRLAIARAILKNAPVLILDEATSALDTESEQKIQQALTKLMAGRTTVVIAHRLSTIEGADNILVMRDGELVEQGSHSQLLALNGAYSQLHQMQFQSE
jgi:subfamily B ATP-binding cassette protein MsbA